MRKKIFILIMMLFGSVCLFNVKCFAKIAPDIEPDVDPYFTSLLNTNLYHTSGEKVISSGGRKYGYFYYDYYIEKLGTYNDGYSDYGIFQYNINASFVPGVAALTSLGYVKNSYIDRCEVGLQVSKYNRGGLFGSSSPCEPVQLRFWPQEQQNELGEIIVSKGHTRTIAIGASIGYDGSISKENSAAGLTNKTEVKFGINGSYTFSTTYSQNYSLICPIFSYSKYDSSVQGFNNTYYDFGVYNNKTFHTTCGGIYEIKKNVNGYYSFQSNISIEGTIESIYGITTCTNNVVFK